MSLKIGQYCAIKIRSKWHNKTRSTLHNETRSSLSNIYVIMVPTNSSVSSMQECIPLGCVLPPAVAARRGVSSWGVSAQGVSAWGYIPAYTGVYFSSTGVENPYTYTEFSTNACETIFLQLRCRQQIYK